MTSPADLGYDSAGYDLPPLVIHEIQTESEDMTLADGQMCLFAPTVESLAERREARKESMIARCQISADIAIGDFV